MTYHKHSYEKRWRITSGNWVTYTDSHDAMLTALDRGDTVEEGYADFIDHGPDKPLEIRRYNTRVITKLDRPL